jgi:hypothetical protein
MSVESLRETQKKLRRAMKQMDKAGFVFTSDFEYASVTVELRTRLLSRKLGYKVYVQYSSYTTTCPAMLAEYNDAVKAATRKARWAFKLVQGKTWTNEEVLAS